LPLRGAHEEIESALTFNWSAIAHFLADADDQPIFVIDGTGVVRLCNRALQSLLGKSRREAVGHAWQRLFEAPGREGVGRALKRVRRGQSQRSRIPIRAAAGDRVIADLVLHPVGNIAVGMLTLESKARSDDLRRMLQERLRSLADRHVLSVREREVLGHLVRGRSAEQIGSELGITPRTAKFHQANVLAKLGIDSRVELTRLMLEPDR
jgi:PAS domain S-box-containing protein